MNFDRWSHVPSPEDEKKMDQLHESLSETPTEEMGLDERPISILSVVAFFVGLLSLGAIWLSAFNLFCFFAIILGCVAIVSSMFRPAFLVSLAYLTVFISGTVLCWTQVDLMFYETRLQKTGEQFAEQWMTLVKDNRIEEVLSLRMGYVDRLGPRNGLSELQDFFKGQSPVVEKNVPVPPADWKSQFLALPVIQRMTESGANTKLRVLKGRNRVFRKTSRAGHATVWVYMEITTEVEGKTEVDLVKIYLDRTNYREGPQWMIVEFEHDTKELQAVAGSQG